MINKKIQIVAFNNPYPPDFGGAIDIYYKIKSLSELGIKIYLHIYYDERSDISRLVPLCETVNLYKKDTSITKHLSLLPFCIKSRGSKILIDNLNKVNAPILFESIRTTSVLRKHIFKQKTAVRCHNIEHDYSWGLYRSERNLLKKLVFFIEGYKLKYYESILNRANILLTLSYYEQVYFDKKFKNRSFYLPVFHGENIISSKNGFGKYALFHGDLSVSDNIKSAFFIISVFKELNEQLIIASSTKIPKLIKAIDEFENISFQLIYDENQLDDLVKNAHINTLYSFQRSGTKLKVFKALYKGRHCILNKNMVDDPDVLQVCNLIENKSEYQHAVRSLFKKEFILTEERKSALKKYDSKLNAENLIELIS